MSVADEILRLQQAKSDLATSITNKGVTVPAATTLDGYAALVDTIQTGGSSELYKSVTLTDAHTTDSKGNPVYWASYLGLPLVSDSTDTNIYLVVFNGNTASQNYRTDFEVFYRQGSNIRCLDVRNSRSNVTTGGQAYTTSRSAWASTGTVINVYRLGQT